MRILWITNTIFPEACNELGINPSVKEGWTISAAKAVTEIDNTITLAIASLYSGIDLRIIDQYQYMYYLIPIGADDQYYDPRKNISYSEVIKDFKPDIVHIHGTEYPHALSCAQACADVPFVVSIQGLVSECWKNLNGGLSDSIVKEILSPKNIIKEKIKRIIGRNPRKTAKEEMYIRGLYEQELLKISKNIIGRTSWDKSILWTNNPDANYYFCNETLRDVFYQSEWIYEKCKKHSIFVSQGNYPLKGLHQVLEAMVFVKREYPDVQLYIGGANILHETSYKNDGYARYIAKKIKEFELQETVHFLGFLSAREMLQQYLQANVFVSASSIENSPNSVGEAQLVGTPCIGSYVGGTMDLIKDGETGLLYRFEETSMLAFKIRSLFGSKEMCEQLSKCERNVAVRRHHRINNAQRLIEIYETIKQDFEEYRNIIIDDNK